MFSIAIKLFINKATTTAPRTNISPQLAGLGIGSISSLVAIGGTALIVPYLISRGLEMRPAIGSSAAIGFPIAVAGTTGYAINGFISVNEMANNEAIVGFVHIPSVIIISICGVVMAPVGVKLTTQLPVKVLKKIFGVLLVCLSIKMLINVML
jgi:uncharacterized membrane protein YfcA